MYGLISKNSLDEKIIHVCDTLGYGSNNNAHLLLSETAQQETRYGEAVDYSWGVGVGVMQFDPGVNGGFEDTKNRTSKSKKDLIKKVYGIDIDRTEIDNLRYSPLLSVIYARLFYLLRPGAIPTTLQGRAEYWKEHYNSIKGKGTVEEYIKNNQVSRFKNA